jgi:putative PIN family toxin of toxin-antitoxin system
MNKRFVLDTNIIISSVLWPNSKPNVAVKKAQQLGIIIVSSVTWQELDTVLFRPKFDRYITFEERELFLLDLSQTVKFILETSFITDICRDPKDNKYLELAVNGRAECIITGDQDLLILHPFQSIEIITVNDFLGRSPIL